MKLKIITVNQNGNVFYVAKIKARDLVNIATNKIRKNYSAKEIINYLTDIDDTLKERIKDGEPWYLKEALKDINIQRKLSKERLVEIGNYISQVDSLFPNSIIINLSPKNYDDDISNYITITDDYIFFDENKILATVIDGQHRLGGFKYTIDNDYYLNNFELVVTIMINLEISQQAELFATINGKQKSVNKSILYDLSAIAENEYNEIVTAHLIVKWFNINENSPWFTKIKMLGYGEGTISQSAFIDALIPLLSENSRLSLKNSLPDVLPVFRISYLNEDFNTIMKSLFIYFSCFKELFPIEWNYEYKKNDETKYILNKTTGLSGLLFAYPLIYCYCYYSSNFSYEFTYNLLQRLLGFDFSSKRYTGGGKSIQSQLAYDLTRWLFSDEELERYKSCFLSYYLNAISNIKHNK